MANTMSLLLKHHVDDCNSITAAELVILTDPFGKCQQLGEAFISQLFTWI